MTNGQGGYSPSDPEGGDAPERRDDISELDRGLPRIGTPVHVVVVGNPSGAPCLPASYLGFDGRDAWVGHSGSGPMARARYEMPGMTQGPMFTYGTFHIAARCDVAGPIDPPQRVAMTDGPEQSTDIFRPEETRRA